MSQKEIFTAKFGVLQPKHLKEMMHDSDSGIFVMTPKVQTINKTLVHYLADREGKYRQLQQLAEIEDANVGFAGLLMGGIPMYLLTGETTNIPGYEYDYDQVHIAVTALLTLIERADPKNYNMNLLAIRR